MAENCPEMLKDTSPQIQTTGNSAYNFQAKKTKKKSTAKLVLVLGRTLKRRAYLKCSWRENRLPSWEEAIRSSISQ